MVGTDSTTTMAFIREGCVSGAISLDWSEFKIHLKSQLEENFQHFLDTTHSNVEPQSTRLYLTQEDKEALDTQHELIQDLIDNMEGTPFTLQRLCELLAEPNRHHPTLPRYLRAIIKLCRVSTKPMNNDDLDFVDVDEASMSLIDVEREKRAWSPGVSSPPKRQRSESPEEVVSGFTCISIPSHGIADTNGRNILHENDSDSMEESNADLKTNGTSNTASGSDETLYNGQERMDNEHEASSQRPDQDVSEQNQSSQEADKMEYDEQMDTTEPTSKDISEPESIADKELPANGPDPVLASSEDSSSTQKQDDHSSNVVSSMPDSSNSGTSS